MNEETSKPKIDLETQTAEINLINGPATIRGFENSIECIVAMNKELVSCVSTINQMRSLLVSILRNPVTPGKFGKHFKLISKFIQNGDESTEQVSVIYLKEAPFDLDKKVFMNGKNDKGDYRVNLELEEHNVEGRKKEEKENKEEEKEKKEKKPRKRKQNQK